MFLLSLNTECNLFFLLPKELWPSLKKVMHGENGKNECVAVIC